MKHWYLAFVFLFLPISAQAAIGITTPTVASGELIRASDWNKMQLDLESLAAAVNLLENQSWSSSGNDTYYDTGRVGIGTNSPTAELSIFLNAPNANDSLLLLGTSDDSDRFMVDEDGDVTMDGDLLVRGGDIYESSGDLKISGEGGVYISADWDNGDPDDQSIYFGKNNPGAGANFVELMRIQENGRVGIRTANPQSLLHVNGPIQIGTDAEPCNVARAGALRFTGVAMERCDGASWDALATTSISDNLGNHLATQNIDLDTFKLVGGGSDGMTITSTSKVGFGGASAPTLELEVANVAGDSNTEALFSTDGSGATAYTSAFTESPVSETGIVSHGSGRSLVRYGQNVSGWGELQYTDASGSNTGGLMIGTQSAVPIIVGTGNTERMRITATGDVGIGISNPTVALQVQKAAPAVDEILFRVGSVAFPNRFEVDEVGDVYAEGNYYVGGGNVITDNGSITFGGEDSLYLAMDWNGDDAGSRSILFGKDGYGGGGGWQELARLDESGSFGLNTNNPANRFHVVENDAAERAAVIENQAASGSPEGLLVLTGQGIGPGAAFGVGTGNPTTHTKNFVVTNAGNVGIGDPSPDATLTLDVEGQIGATQYCDENGLNCASIASVTGKFDDGLSSTNDAVLPLGNLGLGVPDPQVRLEVLGTAQATSLHSEEICDETGANCVDISAGFGGGGGVVSDCGPSAMVITERASIVSNGALALGNGQSLTGTPGGCPGTVTKIAAMCSTATGVSLDFVLRKNGVATSCIVPASTTLRQAVQATCSETFTASDVLNIYAGTEIGSWQGCVATFWIRYD